MDMSNEEDSSSVFWPEVYLEGLPKATKTSISSFRQDVDEICVLM
jgi:hypothetical protein